MDAASPRPRCERLAEMELRALPGGLLLAVARSRRQRGLGLARLDAIAPGEALLLPRCRSVHTFGMRFALDVILLDSRQRPVRVARDVAPRRLVGARAARAVLECNAGEADRFLHALACGRGQASSACSARSSPATIAA